MYNSKYFYEYIDQKTSDLEQDERLAGFVEGAAYALSQIMYKMSGESPCSKSYDPMLVEPERKKMYSYAFDMKDGGRSHLFSDYESISEVVDTLVEETIEWVSDS